MASNISLELAEKMLTKFNGDKTKYHEFIDNCDKAIKLIKPESKATLLFIIETKITDNARALIRNREFENWESLKSHLENIYSEKRTVGQWHLELNSCRQSNSDNVLSFSNKIENLYIKIINSLDSELKGNERDACVNLIKDQALNVFINGLNKDLNLLVKSQKPETLEEAVDIALTEERQLKSNSEIQKFQNLNISHKFCSYCKKSNHTNSTCRLLNQNNTRNTRPSTSRTFQPNFNSQSRPFQNNFQSNSNSYPRSYQNNIKHFSNRNSNNFQQSPRLFCAYCKKPGHHISECRKRQFNNSSINSNNNSSNTQSSNSSNSNNSLNGQNPRQPVVPRRSNHIQTEQIDQTQVEFQQ